MSRRKKPDHPAYSLLPAHETPGYPEAGQAEAATRSVTAREPISLAALRSQVEPGIGRIDGDIVLALLDAVEAAQAVVVGSTYHGFVAAFPCDDELQQRLHEALERFTP